MNIFKYLIKIILIFLNISISTCYFDMTRDNTNDPDSDIYKPPVIKASFIPSVISGYVPLEVHFSNNSSGNIETYEWDFDNDGIIDSTEQNPHYTFNKAGWYDVKLKATTRQGLVIDEITKSINVTFCIPERQVISEAVEGPYVIYPADIDNDGDNDILCGYYRETDPTESKFSLWENIDGGASWQEHNIEVAGGDAGTFVISLHVNDIDDDGDSDIAGAVYRNFYYDVGEEIYLCEDKEIIWWENLTGDGNSWTGHIVKSDLINPSSVFLDDINNDGNVDIIGASNGSYNKTENDWEDSEIFWFQNTDGTGTSWIEHSVKTDLNRASEIRSADIDGDGKTDIVAGVYGYFDENPGIMDYKYSEIILFKNNDGNGLSWTEQSIMQSSGLENSKGTRDIYINDMDNDGDMDVVSAFWLDNKIVLWQNIGGAGAYWRKNIIDMDFFGAQTVHAADIDNDGDMDIVGASRLGDKIAWWENIDGQWNEWKEHNVDEAFTFASSAYAVDINNDGYLDIAGAANGYLATNVGSSLAWWSVYYLDED